MRKIFGLIVALVVVITILCSLEAKAQDEKTILHPMCRYSSTDAECRIWNTSGKQTSCNLHIRVRTTKTMYTDFKYVNLFQGQTAWFSYRANDPRIESITGISATAFCN